MQALTLGLGSYCAWHCSVMPKEDLSLQRTSIAGSPVASYLGYPQKLQPCLVPQVLNLDFPPRPGLVLTQAATSTTITASCTHYELAQEGVRKATQPPSTPPLFFSYPGTRVLNQCTKQIAVTHQTSYLCKKFHFAIPLRLLFLTSFFLCIFLVLDCSGHKSTWESHSPCPWKLITMQIAQHQHRNTLCVAHQNLTDVATISQTVLKWAGLHFDPQDPWEHMGQQVLQGAHWYCCSAPTTPNCLEDGRLQHPWRNETVLEHLAHKLQLPLAGNFWILPMASLSHKHFLGTLLFQLRECKPRTHCFEFVFT